MARPNTSSFDQSRFLRGLARAFAGAMLFGLPLMMTMEMWWLGFYLQRGRLLMLLVLTFILLVPLSRLVGFEKTKTLTEDVLDALVAWGVGALASAVLLTLFGLFEVGMSAHEVVGKLALQTVPASIGAILARGQMGGDDSGDEFDPGYGQNLLIMLGGAIFFAFNVAPTEEMIVISYKMHPWQAFALIGLSIGMLLAFIYALDFKGAGQLPKGTSFAGALVRQGLAGYGVAAIVSAYMLWTFGRLDDVSAYHIAMMVAVLGFPATLGAAAARLII